MTAFKQYVAQMLTPSILGRLDYYRYRIANMNVGGPFNEQKHRQKIFLDIIAKCDVSAIVETGTFRGATTAFMAAAANVPIFTVEHNDRHFEFSRQNLRAFNMVQGEKGDSRSFLRGLITSGRLPPGHIFFYLDAHWGADLPLVEELDIILGARNNAIIMIDDFEVPTDSGYGYDDYGPGKTLTYDYIAPAVQRHGLTCFAPSLSSRQESGMRRGCAVLTSQAGGAMRHLAALGSLVKVRI